MERLKFEDYEEFACDIADKFDSLKDKFGDVSIIAKYNEAREIIRELLCLGYDLCNIIFEMPDWDGYNDEYVLSLSSEGLWCEKFKRDTGYLTDESNVIYVMDNCSSVVFKYIDSENVYEVCVGEDTGNNENTNTQISSNTKEVYCVNGKEVDKDTCINIVKDLDEYFNIMRRNLLNYCEFMDEMNEWCKLFR